MKPENFLACAKSRCLPSVQRVKMTTRADGKHRDFIRTPQPTNCSNEPGKLVCKSKPNKTFVKQSYKMAYPMLLLCNVSIFNRMKRQNSSRFLNAWKIRTYGGENIMAILKVGRENSNAINIYYEDHGSGRPIVLIHGWPLNGRSWEKQIPVLLDAGFRVITYDRRGFGKSSHPSIGYDANTLSSDLDTLMIHLNLQDAILVGFSMGGAEVARYLGKYGSHRVSKAVFISAVTPFLVKTPQNEDGVDASVFDEIRKKLKEDRPKFLTAFFKDFYNVGSFDHISEEAVRMSWLFGIAASGLGSVKAVDAWLEDFRADLKSIQIPVLVVHGELDKTVPIEASGERMKNFVPQCEFRPISGAPHGLNWTHAAELNNILLEFAGRPAGVRKTISTADAQSNTSLH